MCEKISLKCFLEIISTGLSDIKLDTGNESASMKLVLMAVFMLETDNLFSQLSPLSSYTILYFV